MPGPDSAEEPERPSGTVAAFDCGTNSTRLLVATSLGEPLDRRMTITRLGAGVDATGRLDPDSIDRTAVVLREYQDVARRLGVHRARLVATSAVRDAVNAGEFLAAAEAASGVRAEVLSGEEEGRLSFAGATAELQGTLGSCLVADIGGGSTELIVGEVRSEEDGAVSVESLDVGCVRLTERYLLHDPPLVEEVDQARSAVTSMLVDAERRNPAIRGTRKLIGLAGTVSALASVAQRLESYDRDRVHHFVLDRTTVTALLDTLARQSRATRRKVPGLEAARADVIVGGAVVLSTLMDHLGLASCLVSESDILDGLVLGLVNSCGKAVR